MMDISLLEIIILTFFYITMGLLIFVDIIIIKEKKNKISLLKKTLRVLSIILYVLSIIIISIFVLR